MYLTFASHSLFMFILLFKPIFGEDSCAFHAFITNMTLDNGLCANMIMTIFTETEKSFEF